MTSLKKLLKKRSDGDKNIMLKDVNVLKRWIVAGVVILGFVGFLDASYLTAKNYLNSPISCSVFSGCDTVTTSKYAYLFSIPIALLGVLYYLSIVVLGVSSFNAKNKNIFLAFFFTASAGFIFSFRLVYLQIFIIKEICLYCLISAAVSFLIFVLSAFLARLNFSPMSSNN